MSSFDPTDIGKLLDGSAEAEWLPRWDQYTTGPQVLRTICQFANDFDKTCGGYVVIGADRPDGLEPRPSGLSSLELRAAAWWIHDNCSRFEPPYQPQFRRHKVDEQSILVIWAPGSDKHHRGPYGGGSAEGDPYAAFDRVERESRTIQQQAQRDPDEAERTLNAFEADEKVATDAKSHVRNTLIHACIEAGDKGRAKRLLTGAEHRTSGYAIDAAVLAFRVRDALFRQFLEIARRAPDADPRTLLQHAQVKVELAIAADSEYDYTDRLRHAFVLFEQALGVINERENHRTEPDIGR